MASNVVAFFSWPPTWIGGMPFEPWEMLTKPKEGTSFPPEESVIPASLAEEVIRRTLANQTEVMVLRQGSFHFDFSNWEPGALHSDEVEFEDKLEIFLNRVYFINAFLVFMYSENSKRNGPHLDKFIITSKQLKSSFALDDNQSTGFMDPFVRRLFELSGLTTPIHLTDWRIKQDVVATQIVEDALTLLDELLSRFDKSILGSFDVLARSYKAYEDMDFNQCLINCWIIVERLVTNLWTEWVSNNRTRTFGGTRVTFINRDRKKKLTSSSYFTASNVMEILSLLDVLPFQLYKEIDQIRKARNEWMHEMSPVGWRSSYRAVKTTEALMNHLLSLNLDVAIQFRFGS